MDTKHTLLLTLVIASQALAQTTHLATRFKQLDKNGDGKLNAAELPYPNLFKRLGKDGDGFVSPEEAAAIRPGRRRTNTPSASPSTATSAGDFKPRDHGEEAAAAGLKPDMLAKLDIAMQQAVANKEVSGVIGLIHHNGHRGYFEAFGWQDIEAQKVMPKDAIFRLQSMTKPIIAACALTLYDEGRFTLDQPISKHLTEWNAPEVLENGKLVPAKFAITPRMLMSHSSGLYYGHIEKGARSKPGNEGRMFTPVATTSRGARTTLKEFSESLARAPLKFHPGTGYQYGHSIDVLGRYIEAVAAKPLDEVLEQRLLEPLKMVDTDFWVHPENAARICQVYRQPKPGVLLRGREARPLTEKPTLFLGGQGLCSTTGDYERFCLMLMKRGELDGVRVLKAETVDLMFQNHLRVPGHRYGLGGMVDGEGGYAWGGANGTQFWIDRKNNLFAIFMVQTQLYRAPTYGTFRALAKESVGGRGAGIPGQGDSARAGGRIPSPTPSCGSTRGILHRVPESPGKRSRWIVPEQNACQTQCVERQEETPTPLQETKPRPSPLLGLPLGLDCGQAAGKDGCRPARRRRRLSPTASRIRRGNFPLRLAPKPAPRRDPFDGGVSRLRQTLWPNRCQTGDGSPDSQSPD